MNAVHSPPGRDRKQKKTTSITGYFRRPWIDLAIFCVAVVFAVGTVAVAPAARRPPQAVSPVRPTLHPTVRPTPTVQPKLPQVHIVGSVNLLTDTDVRQELRKTLGLDVTATQLGSSGILQRLPFQRYKVYYLPNQIATQQVQDKLSKLNLANKTFPIFRSRLVVATYKPIADLLHTLGVASAVNPKDRIGTIDLAKYVAMVNAGTTWEQIPGNKNGQVFASNAPVTFATPDPQQSAISQLFAAEAAYAVNGDRVPTDAATAARLAQEISPIFSAQPAMETAADTAFEDWRSADDMAANPATLTYENQYVQDELIDQRTGQQTGSKLIKDDMVLLYLTPEAFDVDSLIGVSGTGDEVAAAFMSDPKITALTEQRYAFIPPGVSPDQYAAAMGKLRVTVKGELPANNGVPSTGVMSALLKGLP